MNPKYPIYIPSKGRYNSRHTVKAMDLMKVPYKVVVEPSEFENYKKYIDPLKILVLPADNMLLIGSRNWIKEHSMNLGHLKHWQLDDNIAAFNRLNNNLQVKVTSGTIFKCAEDFCDRYENIAFAGFQYDFFAKAKTIMRPYNLNTRIYSCTLVDNSFDYKWRSIYNDDTDVCLQSLKDGKCTVLFNAFLQEKATTMTISGGNTEQLYLVDDGRLKMAEALTELHPDVCKVSWKFNRWQHHVNYKRFKVNKLIRKPDFDFKPVVNNYGMILINKK